MAGFGRLAPLWYAVGALIVFDQLGHVVVTAWPFRFGSDVWRFQVGALFASRVSALTVGLVLLGAAGVARGHGRVLRGWAVGVGMVTLAMVAVGVVAAQFDVPLPAPGVRGVATIGPIRGRALATSVAAVVVLPLLIAAAIRNLPPRRQAARRG
ncbi:MAG: hypothetical protein IT352_11915 [Gemmatimonadales bacterium]|nr:hypothetical protein [Gemmatimonadales bacterium]